MSNIRNLPTPFNTIFVENEVGSYKDFQAGGDYPIAGVSFFADYGYLPGYIGEDGHELDFFVGSDGSGVHGYFLVWRSEQVPLEHKFFLNMSEDELSKTLEEYKLVLSGDTTRLTVEQVKEEIVKYQKEKQ